MPARPLIPESSLLVLGKVLSISNDEVLRQADFTSAERYIVQGLFEQFDAYLTETRGKHWDDAAIVRVID